MCPCNGSVEGITFPDFVQNACCNRCCESGVIAQRVESAAEDCGCCKCCVCCCNCCGCGCGGNVGGITAPGRPCGCGNIGGVTSPNRPCGCGGSVGGVTDMDAIWPNIDHRPPCPPPPCRPAGTGYDPFCPCSNVVYPVPIPAT